MFTLCYVNDKARVLVGMDVYHVTHRAICEGRTEDRDVVLEVSERRTDWQLMCV